MLSRRTWKSLGLATTAGTVFAASPLTGADLAPKVAAGLVVGGAVFGFRVWNSRDAAPEEATAAGMTGFPPSLGVLAALYAVLMAPTVLWLVDRWTMSVWVNDHGIFIPFVSAYLAHNALQTDDHPEAVESSPWGLAWLGSGALLVGADAVLGTQYLGVVGLLISVPGLCLLLLGARRTRLLTVPLTVLILAMPIPTSLASDLFLRTATAAGVEPLLHLLGQTAYREATVIQMASHTFIVSNACSGFATLYASLSVAAVLACYAQPGWRKLLLLLAAPPIALAANIGRVLGLVLMTNAWGNWVIDGPMHPGSGVAAFCVAMVALLAIAGPSARKLGRT